MHNTQDHRDTICITQSCIIHTCICTVLSFLVFDIPRSPGKEYLLLALSCMGEWELDVDDDIVLLLGDLTARKEEEGV